MARVKIKIPTLKGLTKKGIATRAFQKKLGERVLKDIKELIAVGKSPVKGFGRYAGYKVDRETNKFKKRASQSRNMGLAQSAKRANQVAKSKSEDTSLYPNSVQDKFPGKQKRPVNLELSGELLSKIGWTGILGGVRIGLISASKRIRTIFRAHNEGLNERRNVPRRPILPTLTGQDFTAQIKARIKSLYLARIRQMISKK